jgi:hypothetical protein
MHRQSGVGKAEPMGGGVSASFEPWPSGSWKLRRPARRGTLLSMSANAIMVHLDFEDHDRNWTLWIEAVRPSEQWIRLIYRMHENTSPTSGVIVAEITNQERVYCFLDQVQDTDEPAQAIAAQIIDMLWTLASEKPPQDALDYLRWRVGEWICDERRHAIDDSRAA